MTYVKTFEVFKKHMTDSDVNVYILLGNHDLWHLNKWDISSVMPLEAIDGVHVINKPCTIPIDDYPVSFLPYTSDPVAELKSIQDTTCLCAHLAVNGAVLNVMHGVRSEVTVEHDGGIELVNSNIFSDWDFVFLGHYHAQQKLGQNMEYVGSPLQLSFGEAFQHKHVIIFDTDTHEKEYVRNNFSPQHFIVSREDLHKYDLEKNFVKVVVSDISSADMIEMRNDLIENHNIGSFEVVQEIKTEDQVHIIEDAKAVLADQGKMLEEYVSQIEDLTGIGALDKDKLIGIGNKIIQMTEGDSS